MILTVTDDPILSERLLKLYRSDLYFSFFSDSQNLPYFVKNKTDLIKLCIIDGRKISANEFNGICQHIKENLPNAKLCAILTRKPSDSGRFLRSRYIDAQIFEPLSSASLNSFINSFSRAQSTIKSIHISADRNETRLLGYQLALTPAEHRILALLLTHPEMVFSVSDISSLTYLKNEASVSVHVCVVNKKAEKISGRPLILSKYGIGYHVNPHP